MRQKNERSVPLIFSCGHLFFLQGLCLHSKNSVMCKAFESNRGTIPRLLFVNVFYKGYIFAPKTQLCVKPWSQFESSQCCSSAFSCRRRILSEVPFQLLELIRVSSDVTFHFSSRFSLSSWAGLLRS